MANKDSDSENIRKLADWWEWYHGSRVPYIPSPDISPSELRRIADEMDAREPLTEGQKKAVEIFGEVIAAKMPETEYEYGLIKMKAFLAGRAHEIRIIDKTVSDEEIE